MDIRYVDTKGGLDEVAAALRDTDRFALDCEAAGFHRYSDRLCLVQITAPGGTFLLDPLAVELRDTLEAPLADPDTEVVMHGADYDVRLLDRDLGLSISGLYDTQITAALLGLPALGLSALLEEHFGVRLSKKYQKADWAERPIPRPMREYAAHDTLHLLELRDRLHGRLDERGRGSWAEEEFRRLERVRFDTSDGIDPVSRIKGVRDLAPRELARLRAAWSWRDTLARERDRATFRIAGDPVLLTVAMDNPASIEDLVEIQGMNGGLARGEGSSLLEALTRVNALPEEELRGLSHPERNGAGPRMRPTPEEEERFQRLKAARNVLAEELGLDRAALISNSVLQEMAGAPPASLEELRQVEGVRRWQVEVMGARLMEAMKP